MKPLFTQAQGWVFLAVYLVGMLVLTWLYARGYSKTKEQYLVADRQISSWWNGMSIAATWVWAPALFIAAQKAFEQGWVGLFWFSVPNALCLVLFGYFARILRDRHPDGFTLSGYMRERFSKRTQSVYLIELLSLSACCFAVQLLGGGIILSQLMGIPFFWCTVAMAAIAFFYTFWAGFKASVATDYFQMAIILLVGVTLIPWVVYNAGGLSVLQAGLYGKSGQFTSLFSGPGGSVFWSFGLSVTIGLMAGPFGDQTFYQRAWGSEKKDVVSAFNKSALIFICVPILMAVLGFVAAGTPALHGAGAQTINLTTLLHFLPAWTAIPFAYMLLCGLVSTLDSVLSAFSCFVGHDFSKDATDEDVVSRSRMGMILISFVGIVIANIPGIKILYLFLFYGTLRAAVLIPTMISLLTRDDQIHEAGIFWGIIAAVSVGLPVFAYGNFFASKADAPMYMVAGSLLVLFLSGLITLIVSAAKGTLGALSPADLKGK